jgi:hypothetical protein
MWPPLKRGKIFGGIAKDLPGGIGPPLGTEREGRKERGPKPLSLYTGARSLPHGEGH